MQTPRKSWQYARTVGGVLIALYIVFTMIQMFKIYFGPASGSAVSRTLRLREEGEKSAPPQRDTGSVEPSVAQPAPVLFPPAELGPVAPVAPVAAPAPPADRPPEEPTSMSSALPATPQMQAASPDTIPAEIRRALVIGNSRYAVAPLRNPIHDARAMAQRLGDVGFEVIEREDLTKRAMEEEIRAFGARLKAGGVGLFYFAGHGVQVGGVNYLLPIGSTIEKEQDVVYEAVDAGRVLSEMEVAENRLNIVILDACRNNPLPRSLRAAVHGLAVMNAPSGTLIAYATSPGSVANDGEGRNGLYTQELLKHIPLPGVKLEDVFKRVRVAVKAQSQGKQLPWETSALEGDFFFVKPAFPGPAPRQEEPVVAGALPLGPAASVAAAGTKEAVASLQVPVAPEGRPVDAPTQQPQPPSPPPASATPLGITPERGTGDARPVQAPPAKAAVRSRAPEPQPRPVTPPPRSGKVTPVARSKAQRAKPADQDNTGSAGWRITTK